MCNELTKECNFALGFSIQLLPLVSLNWPFFGVTFVYYDLNKSPPNLNEWVQCLSSICLIPLLTVASKLKKCIVNTCMHKYRLRAIYKSTMLNNNIIMLSF